MPNFEDWPVLPESQRPKKLFHCTAMNPELDAGLRAAGWSPVDIRTLPETTDDEKIEAVKAYLQGIRLGSIVPPRGGIHFAELEAKTLGLLANKRPEKPKEPMSSDDLEGVLGPLAKKRVK